MNIDLAAMAAVDDTGTPASEDLHKMALLLHQIIPLLDFHGTVHFDNLELTMDEELAIAVGQQSIAVDGRDDPGGKFNPIPVSDDELAIVVGQQSIVVDGRNDPGDEFNPVPLRIVRADSAENCKEKNPGFAYKGAKQTRPPITITYKRRRGPPAGFKSAKSKTEQKAIFDSSDSSYSKSDNDETFEPPTPPRKRRRPTGSMSAKRKTEKKLQSVDRSTRETDCEQSVTRQVYDDDGRKKNACVKGSAEDRAAELDEKLPPEYPSFVKCMTHSQVVQGFWLGLPAIFCRKHLPDINVDIELEDEEGHISVTKYKAYNTGLSGGWRGFAIQQHLEVDDALVFQLVAPTRFKVYILRESKFSTADAALGLLSLDTSKENYTSKRVERSGKVTMSKEDEPEVVTGVRSDEEAGDGGIRPLGPDIEDLLRLLSAPSSTPSLEENEKVKLARAHLAKQMKALESKLSILKDAAKDMDVQMKEMVEKKKDQAVRKLATAPW